MFIESILTCHRMYVICLPYMACAFHLWKFSLQKVSVRTFAKVEKSWHLQDLRFGFNSSNLLAMVKKCSSSLYAF